ncbi:MAG: hypothetical protein IPH04_17210 [Saprospirales bacterium]|nr:hypothetical protein [Saprospirales bacterium]
MRLLFVFFFSISLLSACRNTGTVESDGDLAGYTLEKIDGSAFQRAYKMEGERLIEEGSVLDGKKNGEWVSYHSDIKGFPKVIANYVDGKLSGPYMEINEYGQFQVVAQYRNNKLHGRVAKFQYTRIAEELHYKEGILHGPYTAFFPNSDVKQRSAEFKNGLEDGVTRFYNEQGKITMEYQYKNGEKVSGGMVSEE